jgi:cell division protein FtsQ
VGAARRNRRTTTPLISRIPPPRLLARQLAAALRRATPALVGVAAVSAISLASLGVYHFLTHSPRFAISTIDIRGNQRLSTAEVQARLPITPGDNVFTAKVSAAENLLGEEPWVASASVRRELPDTIVVELHERTPAALVEIGGLYFVDGEGKPFKRLASEDGSGGLPVITGISRQWFLDDAAAVVERVRSVLSVIAAWQQDGRPALGEVHVSSRGRLRLITYHPAVAIELGAVEGVDVAARFARFDLAWTALSDEERARTRTVRIDNDIHQDNIIIAFAKD